MLPVAPYRCRRKHSTRLYKRSLKAAMRTAASAPVASCWVVATEEDEADAADADAELA
jgi:hypothetical protein